MRDVQEFSFISFVMVAATLSLILSACSSQPDVQPSISCAAVAGEPWVPSVAGASIANHDENASVLKDVYTAPGLLTGMAQGPTGAHVLEVSGIKMDVDLLARGSMSLVAEVANFPAALKGSAWPVLVSLTDGVHEFVGFDLAADCAAGFYTCPGDQCVEVPSCAPDRGGTAGSLFLGETSADRRYNWEQRQRLGTGDFLSVNTIPSCQWAGGTPTCPFTAGNFLGVDGKLRSGAEVTYTAKYVLLTTNYASVGDSYPANVKVTVLRKKDDTVGGAMDLNVVLVGTKNISDSHTEKGKQNLNALFSHVYEHYSVDYGGVAGIKLGKINVYEWACADGGDSYANVDINDTGAMFAHGSSMLPADTEAKAINVFLVSTIPYDGRGTVLGRSGGIVGAMTNGTTSSGAVFSSFDKLATYNPQCAPGTDCLRSMQDEDFIDMGSTISHEIGHFLGLNHLSEGSGTEHDRLPDTPACTTTNTGAYDEDSYLTISSCRSASETACRAACPIYPYCPTVAECQFNHVMWWSSKSYNESGEGDGNIFSADSRTILNYSPYVQ